MHIRFITNTLNYDWATRLEGSFGTQKLHYSLLKVRARTQATEFLSIFFGIHTVNAVKMIKNTEEKPQAIGLIKSENQKIEELF